MLVLIIFLDIEMFYSMLLIHISHKSLLWYKCRTLLKWFAYYVTVHFMVIKTKNFCWKPIDTGNYEILNRDFCETIF